MHSLETSGHEAQHVVALVAHKLQELLGSQMQERRDKGNGDINLNFKQTIAKPL